MPAPVSSGHMDLIFSDLKKKCVCFIFSSSSPIKSAQANMVIPNNPMMQCRQNFVCVHSPTRLIYVCISCLICKCTWLFLYGEWPYLFLNFTTTQIISILFACPSVSKAKTSQWRSRIPNRFCIKILIYLIKTFLYTCKTVFLFLLFPDIPSKVLKKFQLFFYFYVRIFLFSRLSERYSSSFSVFVCFSTFSRTSPFREEKKGNIVK